MSDFYTIITNVGLAQLANAELTGGKVAISHIAVGSGLNNAYYNPSQEQTALKNEVWRGAVANKFIDSTNVSKVIFETQIPVNVGGWYIREVGAFDSNGNLIAISKVAESFKPTTQQGGADEYIIRIPLLYSNSSVVNISIDPAVVMASRAYVDSAIKARVNNVKDYGAVGDGITNDTNAFIDAQLAAKTKGNTLYLPDGIFKIDASFVLVCKTNGPGVIKFGESSSLALNDNIYDLSSEISKPNINVVITGDSLSFNAYDWPGVALNTINAYDNYPGLMSWAHMLKDFIHRADPYFYHADTLEAVVMGGTIGTLRRNVSGMFWGLPFNNRSLEISGKNMADVFRIYIPPAAVRGQSNLNLHFVNNPNGNGGLVDYRVMPYPYTTPGATGTINTSGRAGFKGFEPFIEKVALDLEKTNTDYVLEFFNFRQIDGSPPPANGVVGFFQAISSQADKRVYLTGRGAWTASDLLADFTNRIGQYAPDLLILTLGANDRGPKTKEEYASDLKSIIDATRAIKPKCKIIFVAPTPATNSGWGLDEVKNGSTMREFLAAARSVVLSSNGFYFDTQEVLNKYDPAVWRYDNVHTTREGGRIIFNSIVSKFFSGQNQNKIYYNPSFNTVNLFVSDYKDAPSVKINGYLIVQFNSSSGLYNVIDGFDKYCVIKSVTRKNESELRIITNARAGAKAWDGAGIKDIKVIQFSTANTAIHVRPSTRPSFAADDSLPKTFDFYLLNMSSTPVSLIASDTINNSEKYLITW